MPQTVPNSPTNGAVDPTVARNAKPSCVLLCTLSMARWIDIVIHSFMSTLPRRPTCLAVASTPVSAMKRYGLFFFSPSAPARTDGALQNDFSAARAALFILACSYTLVMMMYQLPIDIMTSIPSVIRAPRSPPFHSASRPYGFSISSVVFVPAAGAAAGGGAAGVAVAAGAAGCAWACAVCGTAIKGGGGDRNGGRAGDRGLV